MSLAGIPQKGDTLGRAAAPVTIQVFEDPQCPYCKEWNVDTLPSVVKDYVRTGKVKLVYRGIKIIGPNSEYGLRANYAAGAAEQALADGRRALRPPGRGEQRLDQRFDDRERSEGRRASTSTRCPPPSLTAPVTNMWKKADAAATKYAVHGHAHLRRRASARRCPTQLQLSALDPASFAQALDPLLQ